MSTLYLEGIKLEQLDLHLRKIVRECLDEALQSTEHKKTLPFEEQNSELLTRKEASQYLKVSLVTLSNWENKGILLPKRAGTRVRYLLSDIEQALESTSTSKSEK